MVFKINSMNQNDLYNIHVLSWLIVWSVLIVFSVTLNPVKFYNSIYKRVVSMNIKDIKNKIQNELFQFTWFIVRKAIRRVSGPGDRLNDYSSRMIWQVRLARLFGGAKLYMYGDSNCEAFAQYKIMRRFKAVTVNLGIGGTRSNQWADFIQTERWNQIRSHLEHAVALQNIGGNNVLQGKFEGSESSFKSLKRFGQIAITVPVIYYDAFTGLVPNLKRDLKLIDKYISENSDYIIDSKKFTDANQDNIPDHGVLADLIHYSNKTLIKLVDEINTYL